MAVFYFFNEPTTIYECAAFLCSTQFLLCCNGIWKHDKAFITNKWTNLYSLLCAGLVSLLLVYVIHLILIDAEQLAQLKRLNTLLLSIVSLELFTSMCMFVITVVSMQINSHQHLRIYQRIQAIDDSLIRDFGATLNYYKLLRKNIIVMVLISFAYVSALCASISNTTQKNFSIVSAGIWLYMIITGGPHYTGYVYMNLAEILGIRFRLLQKILNADYLVAKFPEQAVREKRIQRAIEIVKELNLIVENVNDVYKMSLLAAMTHDFTLATSELYIIFGSSQAGDSSVELLVYVALCMVAPLYKMLVTPLYCHRTVEESHRCLELIKQLDNWFPQRKTIKYMVSSTMLGYLNKKIKFQIGLNIVINKSTITMMSAVILNYMLILIQFRMAQDDYDDGHKAVKV